MKQVIVVFVLALTGCATSGSSGAEEGFMSMLAGQAPKKLSADEQHRVAQSPLGSKENPVRTEGVAGQYKYLSRLRCSENKPPVVERLGSVMERSPYGSIMDLYSLTCDAPPVKQVFVDLYHPGYVETAAVPGFTIASP